LREPEIEQGKRKRQSRTLSLDISRERHAFVHTTVLCVGRGGGEGRKDRQVQQNDATIGQGQDWQTRSERQAGNGRRLIAGLGGEEVSRWGEGESRLPGNREAIGREEMRAEGMNEE